mmetsp:Transcript_5908/g.8370  ORF Transcript_5908/g.8370 Transcript_5908/m.8370 type:complete len:524 (+) Transcript_5908:112-1683(+)
MKEIGKVIEDISEENEEDVGITEIKQSYCMSCEESSGVTRLMLTKIPYFREIILSSFECESCGERNTQVQFGGEIAEKGCKYSLQCEDVKDLDRRIIKSDTAIIQIPQIELEIPTNAQRGTISTIEGVLKRAADELETLQPARQQIDPETANKIQNVIHHLRLYAQATNLPFTFLLEDPSGNSFIERRYLSESKTDPQLEFTSFLRSAQENIGLGLRPDVVTTTVHLSEDDQNNKNTQNNMKYTNKLESLQFPVDDSDDIQMVQFAVNCPTCQHPGNERMCTAQVPHFKQCIIMSFVCEMCGFRNSEIKAGGAIPDKGICAQLLLVDINDLSRDILKSDTASFEIPDLDLTLTRGSLGGVYTSVEGLLSKIKSNLSAADPFSAGDSADHTKRTTMNALLNSLDRFIQGESFPMTIILTDPLANSFIGPRRSALPALSPIEIHDESIDKPLDPLLTVSEYTRSWEDNEDLGINDLDTGEDTGGSLPVIDEEPAKPDPNMIDHPNPNFARGCDDNFVSSTAASSS